MLTLAEGSDWSAMVQQGGVVCVGIVVVTACLIMLIKAVVPVIDKFNTGLFALRDSAAHCANLQSGHERTMLTMERMCSVLNQSITALQSLQGLMQEHQRQFLSAVERLNKHAIND